MFYEKVLVEDEEATLGLLHSLWLVAGMLLCMYSKPTD